VFIPFYAGHLLPAEGIIAHKADIIHQAPEWRICFPTLHAAGDVYKIKRIS
jgi:hypothetical protein